eukprot:1157625-Pelagomonas_calceolata.AAC.9
MAQQSGDDALLACVVSSFSLGDPFFPTCSLDLQLILTFQAPTTGGWIHLVRSAYCSEHTIKAFDYAQKQEGAVQPPTAAYQEGSLVWAHKMGSLVGGKGTVALNDSMPKSKRVRCRHLQLHMKRAHWYEHTKWALWQEARAQ